MDGMSPLDFVFFVFVILISYAVRGSAGFGGITVPLLAWVISLKVAVPVVTFLGLISSAAILHKNLKHVHWPALWRIMPYCLIGVAVGLYFFKTLDARALARTLGVFVTAYGLYALWMTWRPLRAVTVPLWLATPTAGSIAGFVGTIFGSMAGMFFAIYLDLLKLEKSAFRATVAAILFGLGIFRALGYTAIGSYDRETLIVCMISVPIMLIGVWIGNRIHANMNDAMFKRLVAFILIASGAPLLIR